MTTMLPNALAGVIADVREVHRLVDAEDLDGALKVARRVEATCVERGINSAHAKWVLAVVTDYRGDLEAAFGYVTAALALDRLNLNVVDSYRIILGRMRRALASGKVAPGRNPAALYEALLACGEADEESHLAYARHLASEGEREAALRVVEALLVLAPRSEAARRLKATLDRQTVIPFVVGTPASA